MSPPTRLSTFSQHLFENLHDHKIPAGIQNSHEGWERLAGSACHMFILSHGAAAVPPPPRGSSAFARSALGTCSRPCSLEGLLRKTLTPKRPPSLPLAVARAHLLPPLPPPLGPPVSPLVRTTPLPDANVSVEITLGSDPLPLRLEAASVTLAQEDPENTGLRTYATLLLFYI